MDCSNCPFSDDCPLASDEISELVELAELFAIGFGPGTQIRVFASDGYEVEGVVTEDARLLRENVC